MRDVNGFAQEYHEANVYPTGLGSPLIDLLNARYVLVPAGIPPGRSDLDRLLQLYPTVYQDEQVRVLENRAALPRAWLVHDARQVGPGGALPLLAAGAVDPRQVALLEQEPPPGLAPPRDPAADRVIVTLHDADRLRVAVASDTPSLLVLCETADPGWRAEVDGDPGPVLTADHILRAVPVPAGAHAVELRYEPRLLRVGTAISIGTYAILVVLAAGVGWRRSRHARTARRSAGNAG